MGANELVLEEAEKAWLEELAAAWSVKLVFRKDLGADMFARITISSDETAWVEMLERFDPEEYYRQWGNRDIMPEELFRFLLLHEIAHRELKHHKRGVPKGVHNREDWKEAVKKRESETDRWAKERLRYPWPREGPRGTCLIGCSGWSYDSWKGTYYPTDLKSGEWLSYYSGDFPTVEINMSFYRLPGEKLLRSWAKRVPLRFVFAAKGSRRITHYRRLQDCGDEVQRFFRRTAILPQLGCFLWQLPPSLAFDSTLLEKFCSLLPAHRRNAVEFRHRSWWDSLDETARILSRHRVAFVGVSRRGLPAEAPVTAEFSYFRFHGLGDNPYQWDYSERDLGPWADRIGALLEKDIDVYAYFNNDADARAVQNAKDLAGMTLRRGGR
jgi:uncharacterized protein YecE (DUF72 family)